MSTTFFSVDVETSALDPHQGDLLTVGAVAVQRKPSEGWQITNQFYVRIAIEPDYIQWDEGTFEWWQDQALEVRGEAYEDQTLVRHAHHTAARMLYEWVLDVGNAEAGSHENVFVAHPAAFDKKWVDYLFALTEQTNPFSYRSLDLRSLAFGKAALAEWVAFKPRMNEPKRPHHALDDAHAQALDLLDLL